VGAFLRRGVERFIWGEGCKKISNYELKLRAQPDDVLTENTCSVPVGNRKQPFHPPSSIFARVNAADHRSLRPASNFAHHLFTGSSALNLKSVPAVHQIIEKKPAVSARLNSDSSFEPIRPTVPNRIYPTEQESALLTLRWILSGLA
jgi:hypothetical protein